MATVRVAGVQMAVSPKLEDNLPRILEHITNSTVDFMLFPEMSLTGYHGEFSDKATRAAWRQVAQACRQRYVSVLLGTGCKTEEGTLIQTRVYNKSGELAGTHEKLVPTKSDRQFCRPGEELRVFEDNGITFGCLISNDMWVTPGCGPYPDPRLSLRLSEKGAQVIFQAINTGTSAVHLPFHESNLALRAIEGKVYIVTANAAAPDGPVNCSSGVMSPEGKWAAQCPRQGEHVYTYDIAVDVHGPGE